MSSEEPKSLVEQYVAHLTKTEKTGAAKTYGALLRSFEIWLDKHNIPIESVTALVVDEYLVTITNSKTSQTVRNALVGVFQYRYMLLPMGDPMAPAELQRITQIRMLRPKRRVKKMEKFSFSPEDLKLFIKKMRDGGVTPELQAGVILLFYFGARPRELAEYLAKAKISFPKREMWIHTEKTLIERYLAWDPVMDPYVKTWYEFVIKAGKNGLPYPGEWVTKNLKQQMKHSLKTAGVHVTSRTARRTFQTQMRLIGVPELVIDAVLGHMNKNIGDVYTDWTQFGPVIRDAMVNNHYMIKNKVV
jgi:site-specific recombinase XerD